MQRLRAMGIRDRPIAPRSPWQNAYVERLIGSIRRECLDHMIVFGEAHLRRIRGFYAARPSVKAGICVCLVPPNQLDRRARHRSVGTKHAAIAWQWLKFLTAALAYIEELTRSGRHLLDRLVRALWATQLGFGLHQVDCGVLTEHARS